MKSLFNSKDKVQHLNCLIYKGICSCEYDSGTDENPECLRHLREHINHEFQWSVLSMATENNFK